VEKRRSLLTVIKELLHYATFVAIPLLKKECPILLDITQKTNPVMQTTFCCSATAFASMMLMVIGLMAASSSMKYEGLQMANKEIVQMPKISLPSQQGPWPQCIGMLGEDCMDYIEQNGDEDFTIELIPYGSIVTMDVKVDRVRVFVDENDIVVDAPGRG